jgi:Ca2+-binding RTX toxin-like protein
MPLSSSQPPALPAAGDDLLIGGDGQDNLDGSAGNNIVIQ